SRGIGFVPQDFAFYPELTPVQNLEYFGAMYDLTRRDIKRRTDELLELLGLSAVGNRKVGSFSGGRKRRVNLAIVILHQPKVIFFAQPTVGADVQSRQAILHLLVRLNQEPITIVYTSHHPAEAEQLCSRIALIDHGKVIACDDLDVLLNTN